MYEVPINAAGRLVAEPQRTVRRDGMAVTRLDIEVRQRRLIPDGWRNAGTVRLECRAWGQLAEHAFASLGCGDRVVIIGRLRQRPVGPGTTAYDVIIEDLGVSRAFTTVWQLLNQGSLETAPSDIFVTEPLQPPSAPMAPTA